MGRPHPVELRAPVVGFVKEGNSHREAARHFRCRDERDELATILSFLRPDDELVVTRLDRLGRDTRDVLNIIHKCEQKQGLRGFLKL